MNNQDSAVEQKVVEVKEYTLKKPITYRGEARKEGEKVKLRQDQADRLKESGHI